MRQIEVLADVTGLCADEVYPIICDFGRYPEQSKAVRSVQILTHDPEQMMSRWEVNFRQGVLRWTEIDRFEPETYTIWFEQVEGDAEHFSGKWTIRETSGGCQVCFAAAFDMGIPSLSGLIEPIAEQALRENIRSILVGLLPTSVHFN